MRPATALLAVLAASSAMAAPAAAGPPPPADLTVLDGEDRWRPDRRFVLEWKNPSGGTPIASVRYRLRDESGRTVGSAEIPWASKREQVTVPSVPGAYTVEVRLRDTDGREGPAADAKLRFDDTAPPNVVPRPPARWIGRSEFPLTVPLERDAGPLPLAGLRGHAFSVALGNGRSPCAAADRCTDAEVAPASADSIAIPSAPEGIGRLRVLAVTGAGVSSREAGEATLRVDVSDPRTVLSGLPRGWAGRPVRLTARASDSASGMAGGRAYTAIRIGDEAPMAEPGDTVRASVIPEGIHRISWYASDAAGNVNDGATANGHANRQPQTATLRIDRTPPRAGFLPQDPADPELVRVRIRDSLSGADPGQGWIGVRPAGSSAGFLPLPEAAPAGAELRARWDSAAHPLGLYEFRAIAFDAAGNRTATVARESGAPMLLTNPLKTTTTLRSGFGGRVMRLRRCRRRGDRRRCRLFTVSDFARRPTRRTVPYGRGLPLSGRLVAGRDRPPGPRPVRVVERFALGARHATRTQTVWTGPDGKFTTRLAPGATREVTVAYRGNRVLASSAGAVLRLGVRSGARLGVSSRVARVGGAPLVLSGKVKTSRGEIPAAGCSVQLQFRLPGMPWEEFRTVRTNRRGRFRVAYRFSDDDSRGARFQFRAHVPAQSEWPYDPGNSRPVLVRGL